MKSSTSASERPPIRCIAAVVLGFGVALAPAWAQSEVASTRQLAIPAIHRPAAAIQPDTFLHAFGGIMAGMLAASAASALSSSTALGHYPLFLPAVGFSAAMTAGIAKETLDSTGFGDPQWSDLLHTVIGGVIAAGLIAGVELSSGSGSFATQRTVFAFAGIAFAVPIGAAFADEIHVYLVKRSLKR